MWRAGSAGRKKQSIEPERPRNIKFNELKFVVERWPNRRDNRKMISPFYTPENGRSRGEQRAAANLLLYIFIKYFYST